MESMMGEVVKYKLFCIKQRLNELKKALKRQWTQERQDEFDMLQKDLNDAKQ